MVKKDFLYKKVYLDLKAKMEEGFFSPGAKLPGEGELSEEYQVSIITVKRALQILAEEGMIRRVPGKGSFIKEKSDVEMVAQEKEKIEKVYPKQQKLIGVILEYAMPSFGMELMFELDKAALAAGYKVCVRFSYGDRERETEEIDFLMSMGIAGLVILPCHGSYYNMAILKLVMDGFSVVVLDKKMEGIQVPSIRTDNTDAVYRLVDYLKAMGKTRIGIITVDDMGTVTLLERRMAFRERINQLRLPVMEECILPEISYTLIKRKPVEDYVVQIESYLKKSGRNLDGVVCMEYGTLLAFLEAVRRTGDEGFSQILPCSVDDVYLVPGGSCYAHVKQDEVSMAKKAIEILMMQIDGEEIQKAEVKIPGIFHK